LIPERNRAFPCQHYETNFCDTQALDFVRGRKLSQKRSFMTQSTNHFELPAHRKNLPMAA
jgi:hypothetical protein